MPNFAAAFVNVPLGFKFDLLCHCVAFLDLPPYPFVFYHEFLQLCLGVLLLQFKLDFDLLELVQSMNQVIVLAIDSILLSDGIHIVLLTVSAFLFVLLDMTLE